MGKEGRRIVEDIVKIRPFRYGNIFSYYDYTVFYVVKIRPFRYGNLCRREINEKEFEKLKSDRFGMEIRFLKF